jgi:hypothetical protein
MESFQISPAVLTAIDSFVQKGECFTSQDIYCVLGVRHNEDPYPIYEQVADAYRKGHMGPYLAEIVHLQFELGGFAKVWRYFQPKIESKTYPLSYSSGDLHIPQTILDHFCLLGVSFEYSLLDGKIILTPLPLHINDDLSLQGTSGVTIPESVVLKMSNKPTTVTILTNRVQIA